MRAFAVLLLFNLPLLAAPVPAEEKPKPRAKLVATLSVPVRVEAAHWMPDGKHVVLVTEQRVLVYPRDQFGSDKPKPLTAFDRPSGDVEVGTTPDGGVSVLVRAGDKVNAENRLHLWGAKTLLGGGEPKADRVIDLEADNPRGAVVTADGSVCATLMTTRGVQNPRGGGSFAREVEYQTTFLWLSGKTGDVVKTVPLADLSEGKYAGSTFDPGTGRLYLAAHVNDETVVTCREADGGKVVWERKLPVKPATDSIGEFTLSPDGRRVAYRQPTLTAQPQQPGGPAFGGPGRPGVGRPAQVSYTHTAHLLTLDTQTGEPGSALTKADQHAGSGYSFSSDARLLFALLSTADGTKLGVWDTKTGTEVKVWARANADVTGTFAPGGCELAIVERQHKDILGPNIVVPGGFTGQGQQWDTRREVVRVEHKSVVGLWDLSAVVK